MKKLFTLLTILMITTVTHAQSKSVLVYSEEEEALVYKSGSHSNGNEIEIESLPGYGTDPVPVDVNQSQKGSFTFKKHPSLVLPEYYTVIITDSLTGHQFDLKKADSYTFDITKATPERFTLQMTKEKSQLTAMR